jgi:hypothetical protein
MIIYDDYFFIFLIFSADWQVLICTNLGEYNDSNNDWQIIPKPNLT